MQAVILAGGRGTRLGNSEIPKVMIRIGGTPVLEHQIELLKKNGINEVILCVKHVSKAIKDYFGNGGRFGVKITYSEEKNFLGTAGAVRFARKKIKGDFLLLYGDVMLNMDISKLVEYHKKKKGVATLVVHKSDHPHDSDIIDIGPDGRIRRFLGKPKPGQKFKNVTNAAVYVMKKSVLDSVPEGRPSDFGGDIFPEMVEKSAKVYGYETREYIKDMGTPERLMRVSRDFSRGIIIRRTAVFLDRDGVINEHNGLVCRPSQMKLIKGSAEGIRMLNAKGFLVIAVTNQPVVARNMCTEEGLAKIHERLEKILAARGARLHAIYYCPHHPDKGYPEENQKYKIDCECRKPKAGMILGASKEFSLNPAECFMVGDTTTDIKTGRNAGCKTILVKTGYAGGDGKFDIKPDYVCKNLLDAAKLIIKTQKPR